jgi:hypothetical protein
MKHKHESRLKPVRERKDDDLDRGRQHFRERAWAHAYEALSRADQKTPLKADDLEQLALAAYLIGRDEAYLATLEPLAPRRRRSAPRSKKLDGAVAEERARYPELPIEVWTTDEHRAGQTAAARRYGRRAELYARLLAPFADLTRFSTAAHKTG